LARYSALPVGVSRVPRISVRLPSFRNCWTMSASHSTARSRGLVGLRVASLYVYSGCCWRRVLNISVAAYAGTDCGRKARISCSSSCGFTCFEVYPRTARAAPIISSALRVTSSWALASRIRLDT
jgi:hypothetical protein